MKAVLSGAKFCWYYHNSVDCADVKMKNPNTNEVISSHSTWLIVHRLQLGRLGLQLKSQKSHTSLQVKNGTPSGSCFKIIHPKIWCMFPFMGDCRTNDGSSIWRFAPSIYENTYVTWVNG